MKKSDIKMMKRKALDIAVSIFSGIAALIGIFFLGWILMTVFQKGGSAFSLEFFTELPAPPGMTGGGLANAILGTLIMTGIGSLIGIPAGMLAGIYLAEYGKHSKFGDLVRTVINLTIGVPSIVVGLFVYTILVLPFHKFSAISGAVALAIIMLPVVARTTEDMLLMVPNALRESALALGMPKWRAVISIICKSAKSGLITGVLLAVARVSGETAPLLFTAMNSQFWMKSLMEPAANLTVTIYNYAMSPFEDWKTLAWGASFLITASVLFTNILARIIVREAK